MPRARLRLGLSSCLLGREVRWDGAHARDAFVVDVLGPLVEWVPVCPELELGMGVPREPIRLVGTADAPRLVAERSGRDHTRAMLRFATARVRELEALGLDGYVTKRGSPSCGLSRVRVHGPRGPPRRDGVGLFARVLRARMPLLPVEEEGRLADPARRESFVERLFAHARWRAAVAAGMRGEELLRFHAAHELALVAHGLAAARAPGALAGRVGRGKAGPAIAAYGAALMAALATPATRGRHARALRRAAGRLEGVLDAGDRRELAGAIAGYAKGLLPRAVPLTLLRHHVRRHAGAPGIDRLATQTYLDPAPGELLLGAVP